MTDFFRRTGILPGTAYVVASDAPAAAIRQARILKARYGNLVQICDGTTDDVEIQAAINTLTLGGRVILSKGTYLITASIIDGGNSNITFEGQGDSSLISTGVVDSFHHHIFNINKPGWNIRNFAVDGTGQGQHQSWYGIYLNTLASYSCVSGCSITKTDQGGIVVSSTDCIISNNRIHDTYSDNIIIYGGIRVTIIGNVCDTTITNTNIAFVGATDCMVMGNICRNGGIGVAFENNGWGSNNGVTIIGNSISGSRGSGIQVNPQWVGVDCAANCTVSSNIIKNSGTKGILISSGTKINIIGNLISAPGSYGILLDAATLYAIQISENIIDSPVNGGIANALGGVNIHIVGNTIRNWGLAYCGISLSSGSSYIIANNILVQEVANEGMHGIYITTVTKGTILGNRVVGTLPCLGRGIWINSTVSDFIISHNYVDGWDVAIHEGAASDYNEITGNDIRNNNATKMTITGAHTIVRDNLGYIARGEVRTISGALAGVTPAAIMLSVDNPFGQAVRVLEVNVEVTTQSVASGTMCVGIGSVAANDYETMFHVLPCDNGATYPYLWNSVKTATYGVQTNPINWATGAGNRYLNFYAHVHNENYVAVYTITVMGN